MWPPPYHTVWESIYTPPMGVPLQTWGHLQPGRKAGTYLQEPQVLQFKERLQLRYSSLC